MRIIIIISVFCLFFTANIANAMSTNEYVAALEQKLFGMTYQNQPLAGRIDRIEQQIYDNSYSGSPEGYLKSIKFIPKVNLKKKKFSRKIIIQTMFQMINGILKITPNLKKKLIITDILS